VVKYSKMLVFNILMFQANCRKYFVKEALFYRTVFFIVYKLFFIKLENVCFANNFFYLRKGKGLI